MLLVLTLGLEDAENLVTSQCIHIGDTARVTKNYTCFCYKIFYDIRQKRNGVKGGEGGATGGLA